jgi:type IX secretion system PorP/SprF family membrane protein
MGLKLGVIQYSANLNQAILSVGNTTDDAGFQKNVVTWIPSAGGGFYINNDKYYFGVSIPNFYTTQFSKDAQVKINKNEHLFIMAGYVFSLNNDIKLKPSTLLKFVKGAPIELDLNTNVWFL